MTEHVDTDRGPAETPTVDAVIQEFFDEFAVALTAGNARKLAGMWATPALVVGDQMLRAIEKRKEVEQFFSGIEKEYNKRGITDTRADIVRLDWPTDRICIAEVRWPYLDARGRELGSEVSTYTLRQNDAGDLKICAVVMHGVQAH